MNHHGSVLVKQPIVFQFNTIKTKTLDELKQEFLSLIREHYLAPTKVAKHLAIPQRMANSWLKPNKKQKPTVYRDITIPLDKSELRTKRNDLSSLEERYQWATYWKDHSNMNYTTNCLFLGHTRFYSIDRQRSVFAMCAFTIHGVIKADIMESMSDGEDQIRFERFVQQVADSMDQDDRLTKYYVVTQHDSIASQVHHRGYRCICLPHFSPDLDPMEQYWSACQNRMTQLVTQCAFISNMLDVFYRMRLIDLQCFCQYSMSLIYHCTNKVPI